MEISIKWNICRICLQEERKNDKSTTGGRMHSLFSGDNKLIKQIYECSGVPMNQNDGLPDKICLKCITILKYAVFFRKSCRESNEYLQSAIQRTKSATSLFKLQRNTETFSETITDDIDLDYMEDHDDLLSLGNQDVNTDEKIAKPVIKHVHNKRKQCFKSLHKEKNVKLMKTLSSSSGKEPIYTMTDCENEYEEFDDIADPMIVHENEENVEEINEEAIEDSEEAINQMITTEVENVNNNDSDTNHDEDQQEEEPAEKSKKDTNHNAEITYSHFTKLDSQNVITTVVNCDDETNDTYEDEDVNAKSPQSAHTQDLKENETDNTLFYIIKKDDSDKSQEDNDYVGSDDNVDFMPMEEEGEEILHIEKHVEGGDDGDNQSQVTSTVVTKEEIDIDDANSNSSRNTQEIDAEYVIDEYIIDQCGSNDPLFHAKVVKNPKNNSTLSSEAKEYRIRRTQSVFGRKKLSSQYLNAASSTTNASQLQVLVCDLCGNNFTNRQLMNAHMKVHRQEKTHECELCFKRFITACNLQAHMRIHTGEKPFECKFCGRRFTDRSTHLRHERIHTNEKPFSCVHCGKSFALATTLHAHLKVHTGERPYRCEPCAKSFKLPHQLKAHQNTHLHKAVEQLGS